MCGDSAFLGGALRTLLTALVFIITSPPKKLSSQKTGLLTKKMKIQMSNNSSNLSVYRPIRLFLFPPAIHTALFQDPFKNEFLS